MASDVATLLSQTQALLAQRDKEIQDLLAQIQHLKLSSVAPSSSPQSTIHNGLLPKVPSAQDILKLSPLEQQPASPSPSSIAATASSNTSSTTTAVTPVGIGIPRGSDSGIEETIVDGTEVELDTPIQQVHVNAAQLAESSVGVRELSKNLGRALIKLERPSSVMIVAKLYDADIVAFTRILTCHLIDIDQSPCQPQALSNLKVFIDWKLKSHPVFDYSNLTQAHPHYKDRILFWTPNLCATKADEVDFIITLGGDGTVLYASWLFQHHQVPPIIPFHLGSLGFLTNFDISHIRSVLGRVIGCTGSGVRVNMRMRLSCTVWRTSLVQGGAAVGPPQIQSHQVSKTGDGDKPLSKDDVDLPRMSSRAISPARASTLNSHRMSRSVSPNPQEAALTPTSASQSTTPLRRASLTGSLQQLLQPDTEFSSSPPRMVTPEIDITKPVPFTTGRKGRPLHPRFSPVVPYETAGIISQASTSVPQPISSNPTASATTASASADTVLRSALSSVSKSLTSQAFPSGDPQGFASEAWGSMLPLGGYAVQRHKPVPTETFQILNDLVVDRGPSAFMSQLEVFVDDKHLTSVQADGLVVATPTGSTAYSLSANGSIVHPEVPSLLVTPICPHTLSFRPMLLPDSVELRLQVPHDSRSTAWASFDGRHRIELRQGDFITVTMSRYPLPTVCDEDQSTDWFKSLKNNLHWNERARQKGFVGASYSLPV